jgi:hypothetical protein
VEPDGTIPKNKVDIIMLDNEEGTSMLMIL